MDSAQLTADDVYKTISDHINKEAQKNTRGPLEVAVKSWILRTIKTVLLGGQVSMDDKKRV